MPGWIKLHRQICENEMWLSEKFTKSQAWIDLVLNANHKDGGFYVRGIFVPVKRGQIAWSEEFMAKRWRWSRNKVRRFIFGLKTAQQAEQLKGHIISLIIIKNYSKYQKTEQQTAHIPKNDKNKEYNNTPKRPASYEAKGMRGIQETLQNYKKRYNLK